MENNPIIKDTSLPEASKSIRRQLLDAINGTEADYTQIPLKQAIFLLAVPMILELVLEATFAVVDIFFVSKLGASAVATVGLTETYLYLLYSLAMGVGTAITAIIARRIGEKKKDEAGVAAIQSIFLAVIISIPFSVAGIFFAKDLLRIMGADQWSIENGYHFTQWMLGGNLVIVLLFVINSIFRGAGDAAIAMRVLWIANGINIILCPLLIFGYGPFPELGIQGSAVATNIGRGTAVIIQLWSLFKAGKHIRVTASQIYWKAKVMINIIRTSLGGVGQMLVGMTSWIFLMRILAGISNDAVAGATIVVRLLMFTLMPAWGLSNAAATLVGQNLGAGQPDRAETSVWKIGIYNMAYLVIVSVVFFFFNESILRIFSKEEKIIEIGSGWLQILSYSYFVYGWWMVSVQAFNGSGDTTTPTKINVVFFWLIQIPLSYFLAITLGWQHSGVFWGVFVSETLVGLFTLWLFKRGKWKTAKV